MSKKYTTNFLEDTNGSTGSANQVLVSTPAGIDWVDGSGSGIIGGPYLPLVGGTLTGPLAIDTTTLSSLSLEISGTETGRLDNFNSALRLINFHASSETTVQGNGDISLNSVGSNNIKLSTANSERMRVDSSGNVGIGTTSPSNKLDVIGDASVTALRVGTSASGEGIIRHYSTGGQGIGIVTGALNASGIGLYVSHGTNNRNVGIGTTSPGEKLEVMQDGGAIIKLHDPGNNSWKLKADTDFHVYDDSGSDYLTIVNSGNVGIGTTSPTDLLTVAGNARVTGTLKVADGTYKAPSIAHRADEDTGIYFPSNVVIGISTNALERMRITSTGNVGIGTTSPNQDGFGSAATVLSIKAKTSGGSANTELIGLGNNDNDQVGMVGFMSYSATSPLATIRALRHTSDTRGKLTFDTSGSERMRIDNLGNVGIGTTSPSEKLVVAESIDNSLAILKIENNFGSSSVNGTGTALQFYGWDAGVTANIKSIRTGQSYSPSALTFETFGGNGTIGSNSLAERMRIDEFGNVGIGTTSPGYKLDVNGTIGFSYSGTNANYIEQANSGFGYGRIIPFNNSGLFAFNTNYTFGGGYDFKYDGSSIMRITSGGNVGIGTTSPDSKLDIEDSNPFVTIQGSSTSYVNAGVQFISNQASTSRGLGNFYYSAHSDVEWFSGLPYNDNDAFVINRNASYTVPSSQSSPPGIGASAGTLLKVSSAGAIQFNNYSGTNKTGTPTYLLGTDASGNIVKTNTIPGSGAGPYLPLAGGTMTGNVIFPGEEANSFKIAFTGASASSGLSTVDQSGAGLYIGANSRVNSSGNVVYHDTLLPSSGIYFDGWSGDDMEFYTGSSGNPTKRLTIEAGGDAIFTGNVGIGTTSPGYRLEVDGGIGDGVKIKAGNAASKDSFLVSTNNDVSKFLVQGDGKVIINSSAGIPTRNENFQVFGKQIITNTGLSGPVLYLGYNSSGSNTIQLGRGRTADGLSYMDFNGEVMSAGQFGFRIIRYDGQNASSELKQIGTGAFKVTCSDSADIILNPNSGNVGISQTNPSHKLDVTGNARFTSTVTASNFILSSDERLKENVEKVCDNRVKADWKTFELKTEKGQKRYGVIAQELEKTNPEFVREDSQGFKSVAYIDLLIAKIAELEARLEKLEK